MINFENYGDYTIIQFIKMLNESEYDNVTNLSCALTFQLEKEKLKGEEEVIQFKKDMEAYKGKCFKVTYNDEHTVFYKIDELIIPDKCTSTYNVIILGEEITFYEGIEHRIIGKDKDLRLDNIGVQLAGDTCKQITNKTFSSYKLRYKALIRNFKNE